MEYVFIFIAAVFVNNIVLAPILGDLPVLRGFQERTHGTRYDRSRYVRDDSGHHGNIYRTENRT